MSYAIDIFADPGAESPAQAPAKAKRVLGENIFPYTSTANLTTPKLNVKEAAATSPQRELEDEFEGEIPSKARKVLGTSASRVNFASTPSGPAPDTPLPPNPLMASISGFRGRSGQGNRRVSHKDLRELKKQYARKNGGM